MGKLAVRTGKQLCERRKKLHLTDRDVALRSGISASTISTIERGKDCATPDVIEKIMRALDAEDNLPLEKYVGQKLRRARYDQDCSTAEAAQMARINANYLNMIERGLIFAKLQEIEKVMNALDCVFDIVPFELTETEENIDSFGTTMLSTLCKRTGMQILNIRLSQHLEAREVANSACISMPRYIQLERGQLNVTLDTIDRIASAMDYELCISFKKCTHGNSDA